MKKKLILSILFVGLYFLGSMSFAEDVEYKYDNNTKTEVKKSFCAVNASVWEKYFEKNSKKLRKVWKKNKLDSMYNTSYMKILFFIDKEGNILDYKVKSSCIPCGDKEFETYVNSAIKNVGKFDKLPAEYNYDYIVFTIKMNSVFSNSSVLPKDIINSYGVAYIDLGRNKYNIQIDKNVLENKK